MQLLAVYLSLLAVPVALVAAHDGHDALQMPLGYVKYPYQAVYPGDDTGSFPLSRYFQGLMISS